MKIFNGIQSRDNRKHSFLAFVSASQAFLAVSMTAGLLTSSSAETLSLSSGESVTGMITLETEDYISLMNENRLVLRFNKKNVTSIDRTAGWLNLETQGDDSFENKLYADAIRNYEQALTLGASRDSIIPKIEKTQNAIIDQELGVMAEDVRHARQLLRDGQFDEAGSIITNMARSSNNDPDVIRVASQIMGDILVSKARFLVDNVRHKDAEKEYLKAINFVPGNPSIYIELGDLYARKSIQHQLAIKAYLEALRVGDQKLPIEQKNELNYKTAELYYENGIFEQAARHYRIVYTDDPLYSLNLSSRLIDSLTNLANADSVDNQDYAIDSLRAAAKIAPENADVHELLADLLTDNEIYPEAIDSYKQTLRINSNRRDVNEKLAYIYRALREPEEESFHLENEVAIDPEDYESLCDLGDVKWKLGDWDDATDHYREAQELDPENPRALVALASSERKLGNFAEARRTIQEILKRYPEDIRAQLEMGLVFLDEKKYSDAEPFFTETIRLIEENPLDDKLEENQIMATAFSSRGTISLNIQGPSTAINDYNRALEFDENFGEAHFNIGEAFQKKFSSSNALSDLRQAEEYMLKAKEVEPENAEFIIGLGLFYHKTLAQEDRPNETMWRDKALEQYNQYVDLGGAQIEDVRIFIDELSVTPVPVADFIEGYEDGLSSDTETLASDNVAEAEPAEEIVVSEDDDEIDSAAPEAGTDDDGTTTTATTTEVTPEA